MSSDIGRQHAHYRRGLVLGFTVAETMLLILFALLLALGALLFAREKALAALRAEVVQDHQQIKFLRTKAEVDAARLRDPSDDQFIRELVRAREDEASLQQQRADLTRRENELEQQSQLAKAVAGSPEKAREIRRLAALGERVESEAQRVSTSTKGKDLYDLVPSAIAAASAARQAGYGPEQSKELFRQSASTAMQAATYRGQIAKLRSDLAKVGKGGDYPPCWITEAGKIEYLFDITLGGNGDLRVRDITPPERATDRQSLDVPPMLLNGDISTQRFLQLTTPLREHEDRNDCRFFVMVGDATGPTQKVTFKNLLLTVQAQFYTLLHRAT